MNFLSLFAHWAEFLRPLKRPGEAVGVVALDQVGVRLFAVVARPQLHHIVIPLVGALRGKKTHQVLTRLIGFVLKCTHQNKSSGYLFFVFFYLSYRLEEKSAAS